MDDGGHAWRKLPDLVWVKFATKKTWTIDPELGENVYPLQPARSQWHLDAGRAAPRLAVSRKQFQLAPGFAIAAHAAQGQNLWAAIADFGGDKWTFYIAITRVLSRDGLGIYRPFPLAPFTQQPTLGRSLLLRVWRGERIDWAKFKDEHLQERPCSECAERKPQKAFTMAQWRRQDNARV